MYGRLCCPDLCVRWACHCAQLDVRLDLSTAVELSYADLDTAGEDGDDNDDVF